MPTDPALRTRGRAVLALVALASAACGRDFEPASHVESLRVLGVQLSSPFARPGETEHVTMLAWDASPFATRPDGSKRPLSIAWIGGCDDPPDDLYYACYPRVAHALATHDQAEIGASSTFDVTIPADVITRRSQAGRAVPYGLSYLLYAVCGGTLVPRAAETAATPPLSCVDADGAPLGQADFVMGYLPIYAYDDVTTHNPLVTGGAFDGRSDEVACASSADCGAGDRCGSHGVCLQVVPRCASGACASYDLAPAIDPASAEPDELAAALGEAGRTVAVDVAYYGTSGTFSAARVRANDPTHGWNASYDVRWTPAEDTAGEVRLWAVVRTNRGGAAWWSRDVVVE